MFFVGMGIEGLPWVWNWHELFHDNKLDNWMCVKGRTEDR